MGLLVVAQDTADVGEMCPKETFRYFFIISTISDKIVLQLDRLTAVRFPYYYKEKMDMWMLLNIIGNLKGHFTGNNRHCMYH